MFLGYMRKKYLQNIGTLSKKDIMNEKFNNRKIENFKRGHF